MHNKNFLITGHTGFQGFWLSNILFNLGYRNLYGIGLKPKKFQDDLYALNKKNDVFLKSFFINVSDKKKFHLTLDHIVPDYIFHLASQPLVGESFLNPLNNFETNIGGSINLLEWLRAQKRKIKVIFITSDKCYQPSTKAHKEEDKLGGLDPYSSSKSIQEILVKSYHYSFFSKKNFVKIATARSGNIYGGGDFTPGRLVPDIMNSIFKKEKLIIRNPYYVRPWQYITDSIIGYIKIAQYLKYSSSFECFNFGPSQSSCISVKNLIKKIEHINKLKLSVSNSKKNNFKENESLRLISKKAKKLLNWKNDFDLDSGLKETYLWYENYFENPKNIVDYTQNKINKINININLI